MVTVLIITFERFLKLSLTPFTFFKVSDINLLPCRHESFHFTRFHFDGSGLTLAEREFGEEGSAGIAIDEVERRNT